MSCRLGNCVFKTGFNEQIDATIKLPKENMAKFAVYLLLDRMKSGHNEVVRIELEGKLMIRNSCRPADETKLSEYYI